MFVSKIPFLFASPSPGDIIAFRQPGYGLLIKRIQHINQEGVLHVVGNHDTSIDSRVFGTIGRENIIGRVIWHIRKA